MCDVLRILALVRHWSGWHVPTSISRNTLCFQFECQKWEVQEKGGGDTHTLCLVLSLTILVKLVFSSLRGWWREWEVGVWNWKESLWIWTYKMLYNILCSWGKGRNLEGPISWRPCSYLVSLKPLRHLRDSFCVSPFSCSVMITMLSCFFFFQVNSSSYIMWSTSWPEVNIKCLSFSPKYNPVKLFFYAHWFFFLFQF